MQNCAVTATNLDSQSSQLLEQLRINNIPSSPLEIENTRRDIANTEAELTSVDLQIAQLKDMLTEARSRRSQLKNLVEGQRSLLSPIRRLPVDMLRTIFQDITEKYDPALGLSRLPVFSLGGTCAHWQDIVHHTPSLWSKIPFHFPHGRFRRFDLLDRILTRSESYPLIIDINLSVCGNPLEVLQPLLSHSNRWEEVLVRDPSSMDYFQFLQSRLLGRLSSLSRLSYLPHLNPQRPVKHIDVFGLGSADALRQIAFKGDFEPSFSLPWDNITSLYHHPQTIMHFMHIISIHRNLTNISFSDKMLSRHHQWSLQDLQPLTLPSLITFQVEMEQYGVKLLSFLFAKSTLPSLRKLSLKRLQSQLLVQPETDPFPHQIMTSFFERSGCGMRLREMVLSCLLVDDEDVIRLLQSLSALESLSVEETTDRIVQKGMKVVTARLLKSLAFHAPSETALDPNQPRSQTPPESRGDVQTLVPNLRHLSLAISILNPQFLVHLSSLTQMVLSRANLNANASHRPGESPSLVSYLESFTLIGLQFAFPPTKEMDEVRDLSRRCGVRVLVRDGK
jgi:hypothetical protein